MQPQFQIVRVLRTRGVTERTGLSRSTLARLRRAGEFPAPIRLSSRAVGWEESAVTEWLASRSKAASQ